MSKLIWDQLEERIFESGVKKGVLYPQVTGAYPKGVVWNGLTAVNEAPTGAEETPLWADDIKYAGLYSAEQFAATIEAYMYPDDFGACIGEKELTPGVRIGQQKRTPFGMSYVTTVGNAAEGDNAGYKLHLVYGGMASVSEKAYATKNDSPEAITFSWEVSTTPVPVKDADPTATMVIDSTKVDKAKLTALEDILYGSTEVEARLPMPDEVNTLMGTTTPEG